MTGDRVVISRTAGRPWILALALLAAAAGFLWLALASKQQSPRVAGWVFGGAFGLLGLNLVLRSLRNPVRNELVLDETGISRVIGGVAWAVRWDELCGAAVVERNRGQVVLSPAHDGFESRHRSLVAIGGGDFLAAGIELSDQESSRVREALAKHVVEVERVVETQVPAPTPVKATAPRLLPPPLESSASVAIHVNGWNRFVLRWVELAALAIGLGCGVAIEFGPRNGFRTVFVVVFAVVVIGVGFAEYCELQSRSRKFRVMLELSGAGIRWKSYYREIVVSWPEIAGLRKLSGYVEFQPADRDFPLDRAELEQYRQPDGWYRLPHALSAAASKRFEAHVRSVLPGGVVLFG